MGRDPKLLVSFSERAVEKTCIIDLKSSTRQANLARVGIRLALRAFHQQDPRAIVMRQEGKENGEPSGTHG